MPRETIDQLRRRLEVQEALDCGAPTPDEIAERAAAIRRGWMNESENHCLLLERSEAVNNFRVPVCVRDGEQLAVILVAGIEFQMGIGDLRAIIACAKMDIRNASGPVRRVIESFLPVASDVCDLACSLAPQANEGDMERNRERWEHTGIGGVQELKPIIRNLAELYKVIRHDWAGERKKYAERGQKLLACEDIGTDGGDSSVLGR